MTEYSDYWYRSADGLRLYARDYPGPQDSSALPVLCMHGLSRNSADFAGLAAHLARQRRVIVVDQRGRGRSEWDPQPARYTPQTYVQDMFLLLDELGLERVILIGTSMGGLMSFIMAQVQPQRFPALVINDIGPEIDPAGLARLQTYVGRVKPVRHWDEAVAQTREINGAVFPHYSDAQWLAFTRGLYVERDGVPELAYDPAIAQAFNVPDSGAVPPDLWPLFDAIAQIPMLLVRGALSDILAEDCAAQMQARAPALVRVDVPGIGHAPMLVEPIALNAIARFLATVR
jgi:pimeloyl-ACP methyl ester carboxylesterase